MVDNHFFTEHFLQAPGQLGCQRYFRYQVKHTVTPVQHKINQVYVNLGFTT